MNAKAIAAVEAKEWDDFDTYIVALACAHLADEKGRFSGNMKRLAKMATKLKREKLRDAAQQAGLHRLATDLDTLLKEERK